MKVIFYARAEWIYGITTKPEAVVIYLPNTQIIVCNDVRVNNRNLSTLYFNGKKWAKMELPVISPYAQSILFEYKKRKKKQLNSDRVSHMMEHDRRHKHSGGGTRDRKNTVTEYECRGIPLHDFPRVFY